MWRTSPGQNQAHVQHQLQGRDGGEGAGHVRPTGGCLSDMIKRDIGIRIRITPQALKSVVPGFENAKLRNFGMTIGNAHPTHELPIRNAGQQEDHRQVQPDQRGCEE